MEKLELIHGLKSIDCFQRVYEVISVESYDTAFKRTLFEIFEQHGAGHVPSFQDFMYNFLYRRIPDPQDKFVSKLGILDSYRISCNQTLFRAILYSNIGKEKLNESVSHNIKLLYPAQVDIIRPLFGILSQSLSGHFSESIGHALNDIKFSDVIKDIKSDGHFIFYVSPEEVPSIRCYFPCQYVPDDLFGDIVSIESGFKTEISQVVISKTGPTQKLFHGLTSGDVERIRRSTSTHMSSRIADTSGMRNVRLLSNQLYALGKRLRNLHISVQTKHFGIISVSNFSNYFHFAI